MISNNLHEPVMLKEVLQSLDPVDNAIYIDNTFGAGGYSKAILNSANCRVIAFDRDQNVNKIANEIEEKFGDRFIFKNAKFSEVSSKLSALNIDLVDAMIFDIGVSSMQLDNRERGFSFDSNHQLDMRMDQSQKISAFEVVNFESEEKLAKIIFEFGEERNARKIAKKIIETRKLKPINSCYELAKIVHSFYHGYFKTDPATKTFQALRIYVNQELEELKQALDSSLKILKKGAKIIVISFHSLEDKIVKDFFKEHAGLNKTYSRYEPIEIINSTSSLQLKIINKSAISPSQEEISINPRARSAKMRVAIKI